MYLSIYLSVYLFGGFQVVILLFLRCFMCFLYVAVWFLGCRYGLVCGCQGVLLFLGCLGVFSIFRCGC